MTCADWLGKPVRVFAAYDWRKQHSPMAEGEVVFYIDGPSIGVRGADGNVATWPVSLPIDRLEQNEPDRDCPECGGSGVRVNEDTEDAENCPICDGSGVAS